ncbi:major facilitator superfamily transporter [Colletotrichum scovillei]|uniref:Major facilitator superfamily transporter n=1 Tax=Colletotrichum scovillei TaxID=1209932 RepID=A0A9P7R1T4_9PEZI|nr:major facilitator superfamily transporter [Colletotrichum scovillei]KAF4776108.1 major facilitator superfamily transporter [Colletotrichum scovillei]KAG7048002.1 major facilitator superfamily transporter [Colletotrichum scovillei]KAG7060320.1 major facilitator superfamily transporter [Colletotrichum scovillei]KAG7067769.1 major facilitator superfamily transporter [Colletotrichum scovillei]
MDEKIAPLPVLDGEDVTEVPPINTLEETRERWNGTRINTYRFFVTCWSFIIMGMNDAAVGALIPYIETYYNITYTVVALLFLSPFIGYLVAALSNNLIHHKLGQRGVAVLGPISRMIGYIPLVSHPPYPVLPVVLLFAGFGNGLEDSAWNAWVGNMQNANELLGFLHGAYGLGATIGPLVASAMVTKGKLPWYSFYYVMIGVTAVNFVAAITAFWGATGKIHRETHQSSTGEKRTTTMTVVRQPLTWLLALFLLGYVGAEVSLGGWVVTFMLRVRHAEPFLAGVTVVLFWLGLTIGRVILGFITGRIGEKRAIAIYLVISLVLELLYWLVPNFVASVIFITFLGFFLGPLFPAVIVTATKLLPNDYHVGVIGFAAAFGGGGAAIFPFAIGAIAQSKGVQVLQPIILALLIFLLLLWLCVPGGFKRGGLERARENKEGLGSDVKSLFSSMKRLLRGRG